MNDRFKLIDRLKEDKKHRESYVGAKLRVLIPSQIRALRRRREMTQVELAQEAEMKQSRISAMERPGAAAFNLETLVRLAAAFRVGLVVRFVPFSEMLNWENGFSQDFFDAVEIDSDSAFIRLAVAVDGSEERDRAVPKIAAAYRQRNATEGFFLGALGGLTEPSTHWNRPAQEAATAGPTSVLAVVGTHLPAASEKTSGLQALVTGGKMQPPSVIQTGAWNRVQGGSVYGALSSSHG